MSKKIIFTDKSDLLLASYLKDIAKYKILDAQEIIKLVELAQKGDETARDKVVKSNLRFVITVAKQFQNRGVPLMDLISAGNEGILLAIDKFSVDKGVTFLSYAVWWIKQRIYNTIYWHGKEIRLPMSQQILVIKIIDATNNFLHDHDRNPSPEELSKLTDIPESQIVYLSQFFNKTISVDEYIGGDDENSQVCDVIPDNDELLDEKVNKLFITREIEHYLDKLTIRERDIIKLLFGIGMPPVHANVIADMYGIGYERVRQMKESAITKLKRRFSKQLKKLL